MICFYASFSALWSAQMLFFPRLVHECARCGFWAEWPAVAACGLVWLNAKKIVCLGWYLSLFVWFCSDRWQKMRTNWMASPWDRNRLQDHRGLCVMRPAAVIWPNQCLSRATENQAQVAITWGSCNLMPWWGMFPLSSVLSCVHARSMDVLAVNRAGRTPGPVASSTFWRSLALLGPAICDTDRPLLCWHPAMNSPVPHALQWPAVWPSWWLCPVSQCWAFAGCLPLQHFSCQQQETKLFIYI